MSADLSISKDVFEHLEDGKFFIEFVREQYVACASPARLVPVLSAHRLFDAHLQWRQDLERVSRFELRDKEPDHYKQSGHLIYWLRRASPVIEWVDETGNIGDAEGYPILSAEQEFRELLMKYGNEYLSFDLGYRICRYFEESRVDSPIDPGERPLTTDYILTVAHFLKVKNVSPHALFLVLRSLFIR